MRKVSGYAKEHRADFERLVMQTASDSQKQTLQAGKAELAGIMSRMDELDILLQKLYEDYALGRLPEKRHAKLSGQYEAEQEQLEARLAELQAEVDGIQEDSEKVSSFMELVNRYTDFTELTTPMLNEFIDKIVIFEATGGRTVNRSQRIDIYFNFIGQFVVEDTEEESLSRQEEEKRLAELKEQERKDRRNETVRRYRQRKKEKEAAEAEAEKSRCA